MKIKNYSLLLLLLCAMMSETQAQWTNTGNNNTTGTLFIGSSGTTSDKLRVTATGSQRSVGMFAATGTGNAGICFDASNGDFSGSDYASLLQYDSDLSVELSNAGANPINFKTAGINRMTILGNGGAIEAFFVGSTGRVGIGTVSPDEKLEVNGTIRSKEVKVEASPWPDYVFADNYQLTTLKELEAFIQLEGHLPEVPSAKEVEENGIALGEMNALLLKKIEELTLYTIGQQKEINKLKSRIENPTSNKPTANGQQLTTNSQSQEKKIEELTLYQIELVKRIEKLENKKP